MKILVPTLSRAGKVRVFRDIPFATLLVDADQEADYRAAYPDKDIHVLPAGMRGIAAVREYCVRTIGGKILMLDDDLWFYTRRKDDEGKLLNATQNEIAEMLSFINTTLDDYAHLGIAAREGFNRLKGRGDIIENQRYIRAIGVNSDLIPADVDYTRVQVMEDFDVSLQLLERGLACAIITPWAQGQVQTQMAGGCSEYRTHENHERAAHKLAELHPGFVALRQKQNKSGGEFGTRTEVTVYWKKAFASSQKAVTND
jgi:hypothetical protein